MQILPHPQKKVKKVLDLYGISLLYLGEMRKEKKEMNLNETIFGASYMIGVDRSNGKVENINLIDLMDELNFIPDGAVPGDLNVVWYEDKFNDYIITEIYDNDSGEVYWEEPSDEVWTENDDILTNSLLMWGGLEDTIGELY